jgi:hypothetical protein
VTTSQAVLPDATDPENATADRDAVPRYLLASLRYLHRGQLDALVGDLPEFGLARGRLCRPARHTEDSCAVADDQRTARAPAAPAEAVPGEPRGWPGLLSLELHVVAARPPRVLLRRTEGRVLVALCGTWCTDPTDVTRDWPWCPRCQQLMTDDNLFESLVEDPL